MQIDGLTLPSGTHLESDICIVGGGVTGLLLAEQLSRLSFRVHVLESGNATVATADTLDSLNIESSGSELEPLLLSRARSVGGTARIWNTFLGNRPAARYFRLEAVDMEKRDGLPYGGWPIDLKTLDPYYVRAEAKLMPGFSVEKQRALELSHGLPLNSRRAEVIAEGFGLADVFTERLPNELAKAPRITIVRNATVTEILGDAHGTNAQRVRVATSAGQAFTIGFRALVLAAGAIENARLLLASQSARPAGLGNDNDLVGRFYMDHQRLNAGRLRPFDRGLFDRTAFFDLRAVEGQFWMGKIKLSQDLIRERGLLNSSTLLWPRPSASDDRGVDALKDLSRVLKSGQLDGKLRGYVAEVVKASRYLLSTAPSLALTQRTLAPNITRGGWSKLRNNQRRFEYYELVQQIEQAPDPNNRITLGTVRCKYGVRLPLVHAKFCQADIDSAHASQLLLAGELERSGIGKVELNEASFPELHQTGGIHHHLGTTRMHDDPKQGVVDANLRVHGVANVFVTGGSVFPTGGYANPTLTIAALSLRLADHLSATLSRAA